MCNDTYELRAELDYDAARDFFILARHDIEDSSKEDPLRYLFCTRLPLMFPSRPWWIDEHARKAEANESFVVDNIKKGGFADVLIGCTAVEYEKDLSKQAIFKHGYEQVEDYCAGLLNKKVEAENIVGVLSDTVHWYAYKVRIRSREIPSRENDLFGRDDICLEEIENLDMIDVSDENLRKFESFINRYYGRFGSKRLTPTALVSDFGLNCGNTKLRINTIQNIVERACDINPGYARLVQGLWINFVEGVTGAGNSFLEDYSHELYIMTLAKLIVANTLEEIAPERNNEQLREILNGSYFVNMGIDNLVEYDYFGWLNNDPHVEDLVKCAAEIQRDLMVYDFANFIPADLFGGLISQMAGIDKKILLGQAPTPQPIAAKMVKRVLAELGSKTPHLVDMCCGSGIFVVETLRQLIDSIGAPTQITPDQLRLLAESIYGYDVDPLAVLLAKANWVLVMRRYIQYFPSSVHIPIYHADSLFTRTPVSVDNDSKLEKFEILLFDRAVAIPSFLLSRTYRYLFDEIMVKADMIAANYADRDISIDEEFINSSFSKLTTQTLTELDDQEKAEAVKAFSDLVEALSDLRSRDRNGIWPFILCNSFKPAFTTNIFNGIVSNPPWLALSRMRGNPYHDALVRMANDFGIMPHGSAFLHVELATIFFVASIQKYIRDGGIVSCIMPHSLLNGRHEEPFRTGEYLKAPLATSFKLTEIWELPKETFNNRAAVIFAKKEGKNEVEKEIPGSVLDGALNENPVSFKLITNGKATAYSCRTLDVESALDQVAFNQGFDGMPRTAVVFKCTSQPNGKWTISSIPTNGDDLSFAVKDGKKCKNFNIGTIINIDESLLYDMITSNQVMPFAPVRPLKAFLPVKYVLGKGAVELSDRELLLLGRSNKILADRIKHCADDGVEFYSEKGSYLAYIDTRHKLSHSLQDVSPWRVLYGAGGSNISAAAINCDEISNPHKLAIDQTLYWRAAKTEEEALYYVGLLNSDAINDAIKEFQPEGNFGKRHIHTLPLSLISEYDPKDERHLRVVNACKVLQEKLATEFANDTNLSALLNPSSGTLSRRRKLFQNYYKELPEFANLNEACVDVV